MEASLLALAATWLIAGVVFCLLVKGPRTVVFWVFWGTGIFVVGWLVIGLPLVAIGDRVMRLPAFALALAGGLAAALLMLSPNLLVRVFEPDTHPAPFSLRDLGWPGIAFTVGFVAVFLYRIFLSRAVRWRRPIQPDKKPYNP